MEEGLFPFWNRLRGGGFHSPSPPKEFRFPITPRVGYYAGAWPGPPTRPYANSRPHGRRTLKMAWASRLKAPPPNWQGRSLPLNRVLQPFSPPLGRRPHRSVGRQVRAVVTLLPRMKLRSRIDPPPQPLVNLHLILGSDRFVG